MTVNETVSATTLVVLAADDVARRTQSSRNWKHFLSIRGRVQELELNASLAERHQPRVRVQDGDLDVWQETIEWTGAMF